MLAIVVISLSAVLQLATAGFALRLIPLTRRSFAWICISSGFILMAFRRLIPLYRLLSNPGYPVDLTVEIVGLILSAIMLAGVLAIAPIFRNINQALEEQKILNRRMIDIIEFLPDPTFVIDSQKRVIAWNRSLEQMTGVGRENIIGKTDYARYFYNESRPLLIDIALNPEKAKNSQYTFFDINEQTIQAETFVPKFWNDRGAYCWIVARRLLDPEGNVIGAIESIRDITERAHAEQALRDSEVRVRTKLDAILTPDSDLEGLELADILDISSIRDLAEEFYTLTGYGIGLVDRNGKILVAVGWQDICTKFHRAHPESCKNCLESDTALAYGFEAGTYKIYKCKNNMWDAATPIAIAGRVMGHFFLGQFFFSDETPDRELFREQARTYGFPEQDYLDALDRVPRWDRASVMNVLNIYIRFANIISTLSFSNIRLARSLEERKRAEENLNELNRKLEDMVNLSVSELRQKDRIMIQQSRQAAMGEMLRNIAHQWRQPLNALGIIIQNIREYFEHGALDKPFLDETVGTGLKLLTHMSRTIDDFRNYFRPDREKRNFGIRENLDNALNLLSGPMAEAGVEIDRACGCDSVIRGYPNEFAQAILNIINNALEAFQNRKDVSAPRISIRCEQSGGRCSVVIADNAGGIPDDVLPKIFDPYFTTKAEGTGIGLYMAKNIIEKNMGGTITARNTDGGAEFRIELPLASGS